MMELKIPPVLTTVICGGLMWLINETVHPAWTLFDIPALAYQLLFGIAITIGVLSLLQFIKKRTTVDPQRPGKAASIVDTGVYRFTRNPMYLGMLIALIAFCFKLGNGFTFLLIPVFIWYMNRFQIIPEEEILQQKFGADYINYKQQVRRWI